MRVFGIVWHAPLIVMAICFVGVLWGVPYAVEAAVWGSGELPGFLVVADDKDYTPSRQPGEGKFGEEDDE